MIYSNKMNIFWSLPNDRTGRIAGITALLVVKNEETNPNSCNIKSQMKLQGNKRKSYKDKHDKYKPHKV